MVQLFNGSMKYRYIGDGRNSSLKGGDVQRLQTALQQAHISAVRCSRNRQGRVDRSVRVHVRPRIVDGTRHLDSLIEVGARVWMDRVVADTSGTC